MELILPQIKNRLKDTLKLHDISDNRINLFIRESVTCNTIYALVTLLQSFVPDKKALLILSDVIQSLDWERQQL